MEREDATKERTSASLGISDLELGHFTPDGCRGTIHCVAPPFGFGFLVLKVYTKASATFRIREA